MSKHGKARAKDQLWGYVEVSRLVPDAVFLNGKDGNIVHSNFANVVGVSDAEGTSLDERGVDDLGCGICMVSTGVGWASVLVGEAGSASIVMMSVAGPFLVAGNLECDLATRAHIEDRVRRRIDRRLAAHPPVLEF